MRKLLLVLAFFTMLPVALQAAIPDMKFRRLDTRDGLSNSQVLCVLRDSHGFVWIGTPYGLNRYDGYRIKTYYSEKRDTTTLRSNYVDAIYEDGEGHLWLKQGMGYSVFDPVTERCDRHPEAMFEKIGITSGIEALHIDSKGEFWIKTYNDGFFHYRPSSKTVKQYRFGFAAQEFNPDIGVSSMAENGNVMMLASNNGEILCFDREKDVIIQKEDYLRRSQLTRDQSCKLRVDHEGNVWVVTNPRTYVWNPKTNYWYLTPQELFRSWGIEDAPSEMSIWDVLADDKKRLWIATDHGGLYIVVSSRHEIKQFLTNKLDESTISDNTLRNFYKDQLGRVWIGSYMNGLNLYVGNTSSFRNLEMGTINTICHDSKGYTWLGTNDVGIIRYNRITGEQVVYDKANSGIGSNTMVGSLAASDGSVWFGTYEGGLIHIKDGHITNYRATGDTLGLVNNNVWTICEDQWGNIWIGTLGGGVQRIDKRTGRMRTFRISNSELPSDYISTITRTKKGWLMVSHSKYYSLINPKTFRIVNRSIADNNNGIDMTEMSIMSMEDSRGLAWQGSTSGATVWDPKTGEVYLLDMKSGLLGSTVNDVVEDDRHTMWVVTDHGISNVVVQRSEGERRWTFIVHSYSSRDGLQIGPYNQRSACYTKEGLLLVGGQNGLDILNPTNLGKGRMKEVPLFSGLIVSDMEVPISEEFDGRVILKEALNDCRRLKLRYGDPFTIQLASNSGEIHNRSRFVYKLEGFNENWVRTSELNPNISFMSLRYGDYTLRVRMLNDDGTIGEIESTIDIHISAPFWRARWAMLLYILAVLAAAWWWRRYFLRRQAERMEIDNLRREIEKRQWMKEMQAQLEQKGIITNMNDKHEEEHLLYQPELEELVSFVSQTVENYHVPDDKNTNISFQTPLNRLTMRFDPALVSRMIDILLQNAVKFSPKGSKVKVTLSKTGNMAEIRVADQGLGVPEESLPHMFDSYAGLGLDVVKRIAELHNGSVSAEKSPAKKILFYNKPENGTVIVVLLPAETSISSEIPVEEAVIMED